MHELEVVSIDTDRVHPSVHDQVEQQEPLASRGSKDIEPVFPETKPAMAERSAEQSLVMMASSAVTPPTGKPRAHPGLRPIVIRKQRNEPEPPSSTKPPPEALTIDLDRITYTTRDDRATIKEYIRALEEDGLSDLAEPWREKLRSQ